MRAMVLEPGRSDLRAVERPIPEPGPQEVLIRVRACGVCRTDLHVVDRELPNPKLPLIPGHEIVGTVERKGIAVDRFAGGERVGVPWLGWTCGVCAYCRSGRENLCDRARFTGYQIDGGYAEYTLADQRYCFPLGTEGSDVEIAPLLCAGLIGYRALRMAGDARRLGLYGFGAAAHIIAQVARHEGREVYAFTRPQDHEAQAFARSLGAVWAGSSEAPAPEPLDAALIFAPVGALVPAALQATGKGGTVICAGIHMSDIPSFPYSILWENGWSVRSRTSPARTRPSSWPWRRRSPSGPGRNRCRSPGRTRPSPVCATAGSPAPRFLRFSRDRRRAPSRPWNGWRYVLFPDRADSQRGNHG